VWCGDVASIEGGSAGVKRQGAASLKRATITMADLNRLILQSVVDRGEGGIADHDGAEGENRDDQGAHGVSW